MGCGIFTMKDDPIFWSFSFFNSLCFFCLIACPEIFLCHPAYEFLIAISGSINLVQESIEFNLQQNYFGRLSAAASFCFWCWFAMLSMIWVGTTNQQSVFALSGSGCLLREISLVKLRKKKTIKINWSPAQACLCRSGWKIHFILLICSLLDWSMISFF